MAALDALFAPRSVAIVGASPDQNRIRGQLLSVLRGNGFPGRIVPVNPSYQSIGDLPCVPNLAAAGGDIDVALVAIPAERVMAALEECAAAGVGFAVVISSGFAEDQAAPADLQQQMTALARRTGMRVLGPNGEGFHNEVARVSATFSPAVDRHTDDNPTALAARIGIVAQSGGMGFALYNRGRALGLAFSTVVTTGNEADLTAADTLAHMAQDPETAGILLFVETIRDADAFAAAASQAQAAGKPIVAIKVGRSNAGKRAAASHTASMAGWDAGYDAFFARHGIVVAHELDEALSIAGALVGNPRAAGPRTAIVTISGGAGAWAADLLEEAGLVLPELAPETQAAIRAYVPSYGATRNPIDLTAGGAAGGGALRTIDLLSRDDGVDQIVVVTTLANPARVAFDGPALAALLAERRKPVLFYSYTLPSPLSRRVLAEAGAFICPSMAALAKAAHALRQPPAVPPTAAPFSLPEAVAAQLVERSATMTEAATKALLAACGLTLAPSALVTDRGQLAQAGERLGYPLAAKIQSPAIPHKSEAGGVRLGIAGPEALEHAYDAILAAAAAHAPSAAIDGVLLEPMAPPGVEIIVGSHRDPTFGPVISVGAGGITTELFRDVAYRIAPLDVAAALAMLQTLRSWPLLAGFRNTKPADVSALAELIAHVSRIAAAGRAGMAELELNPVIVHPVGQGCTIADALLVLAPAGKQGA